MGFIYLYLLKQEISKKFMLTHTNVVKNQDFAFSMKKKREKF